MKATQFIAAALVFAAGSAFAADAPATAAVASAANVGIAAATLNVPSVTISNASGHARADVHAEAVQNVKNYKTALAVQLELANYK